MTVKTPPFTVDQIKEKLLQVRTGSDFPSLAMNLKNIGVTYYETRMEDGRSIYHGENGYELLTGPNYDPIAVADAVNIEQLKADIVNHQQGRLNYLEISRESANNGIEKWAVCLISMTCAYIDKKGNKIWVEKIHSVIDWVSSVFVDIESAMQGLDWGEQYDRYHNKPYNPVDVSKEKEKLYADPYVRNCKGIFEYILGGLIDTKLLNVRVFDEATKKTVYSIQTAKGKSKSESNCPLCAIGHDANRRRIWKPVRWMQTM